MKPVVVIVGRPNVGKSTLFNVLTRSRDALVADTPGLTRDWQIGTGQIGEAGYLIVDTGGLITPTDTLHALVAVQTRKAIAMADVVLLVVDARAGLTEADRAIAAELRPLGRPVLIVANKSEGLDAPVATADFHALGFGDPIAVSAAHKRGLDRLATATAAAAPAAAGDGAEDGERIRVTVIGRPNVGKSTLVNRMLGEERVITADRPGTTRDSIAVPFERDGTGFVLIDTAGVRRRARVQDQIEKLAVLKTLQALDAAQVAIIVLDAREGISEQDASLLGLAAARGGALIIAVNKWDGLTVQDRDAVRRELDRRLAFVQYAPRHFISALHGSGVGDLFPVIAAARASAFVQVPTARLTRILEQAVLAHPPPLVRGRRIKLRYAHLGGHNPPLIIIHGTQVAAVPAAYTRYLERCFREALKLTGTPVRIEYRQGANPYAGKRNPLTHRQQQKRRRLIRHVKP
ncbi:MAG: ribosome biogenesis GTPase Der [Gammaproteobacteria bacterium]|nr:ribosome biogenesis GTPase Der [Gammaproteobacteria bacterium]